MRPTRTTQTGTGSSAPIILDSYGRMAVPIAVVVSGTANYTVEHTLDNLWNTAITPTWFSSPDPDVVGSAVSASSYYTNPPFAVRVTVNSGSGSATLTAISPSMA